jgi:hypothetical protein
MLLFLNLFQTFLLLLIAAGVGYLVYRSIRGVRASRRSLRSRRREVYGDVMRIVSMLGTKGEVRKEDLLTSVRARRTPPSCSTPTSPGTSTRYIYVP